MSGDFSFQYEKMGDSLIVRTEGYINNIGGEKIAQLFSDSSNNDVKNGIFDLEKSKIINSIGISYLLEVIELLTEKNGKIIFLNLDPSIEKTFKIMGLFQFAQTSESVNSALKELA